jgi:nucleotide-binding universal stress UspA family protein
MFSKILVPLDGSPLSESALAAATRLVAPADADPAAELLLLRVPVAERMVLTYPTQYSILNPEQSFDYSRQECADYLQAVQQRYAGPDVRLRPVATDQMSLFNSDVAAAIVDTAAAENVDLIVMSTHGRSGFSRWMLGSVTERVLRQATRPVLVVRDERPLRQILIPLDGSELAEVALEPGMAIARQLAGRVALLRVEAVLTSDAFLMAQLESAEIGLSRQLQENIYRQAGQYLDDLARPYRDRDLPVETIVTCGRPADSILETADIWRADLIVMASHGRTGLRRWVYGSVTEKVLRGAHCSLLVVRPWETAAS